MRETETKPTTHSPDTDALQLGGSDCRTDGASHPGKTNSEGHGAKRSIVTYLLKRIKHSDPLGGARLSVAHRETDNSSRTGPKSNTDPRRRSMPPKPRSLWTSELLR
jgi:hypothetical protein